MTLALGMSARALPRCWRWLPSFAVESRRGGSIGQGPSSLQFWCEAGSGRDFEARAFSMELKSVLP